MKRELYSIFITVCVAAPEVMGSALGNPVTTKQTTIIVEEPTVTTEATQIKVPDTILAKIKKTGRAQVIINLHDPVSIYADFKIRKAAIAQVQNKLLKELKPDYFEIKYQYSYIPALAGTITQEGITILLKHPEVSSIQLDEEITIQ